MTVLHRHQIAWLTQAGWDRSAPARGMQWRASALRTGPRVVTRQPPGEVAADTIAMGLPAPDRWDRRRLALRVPRGDVLCFDEFPRAEHVTRLLPGTARPHWRRLCTGMVALGLVARVHGSYGWKCFSGLDHVRQSSDVDVWISVADMEQADAAAALLRSFPCELPRLDGELVFDDGAAVAWREWLAWRTGRALALLVKRIDGSGALSVLYWCYRRGGVGMSQAEGVAFSARLVSAPAFGPQVIGRAATLALHDELALSPKPGLVTPTDTGSHTDMDAHTFMRSLFALRTYFVRIAGLGATGAPFHALERCGIEAEARMLAATGGINTHRGSIFMLGLLCAAAGGIAAKGSRPTRCCEAPRLLGLGVARASRPNAAGAWWRVATRLRSARASRLSAPVLFGRRYRPCRPLAPAA
jgi:phosphoribosyl-dephospho-CoA transferase